MVGLPTISHIRPCGLRRSLELSPPADFCSLTPPFSEMPGAFRHLMIKSWCKKQEFYHREHRGHREKQENSVLSVPLW